MGRKLMFVEALESRRLLSVSASALAFPITTGATWSTRDDDGSTDTYKIVGPQPFNGHSGYDLLDSFTSPGSTPDTTHSYFGFENGNFSSFGDVATSVDNSVDPAVTTTNTFKLTPPLVFYPSVMVAGQANSYLTTEDVTSQSSDGTSDHNSGTINYSVKLISETKQRITVPAGTFLCYQIVRTQSFMANGKTITGTTNYWVSPGNYPVKETDQTNGGPISTSVLTNTNVVKTATHLEFEVQPSDAIVDKAIAPPVVIAVEAKDGSIATNDKSLVTLTISTVTPAGGTITGTTSVAAVGGEATFSNLKFTKPGTYTIKASDGSLTGTVSRTFVIKATAASAKLAFGVQPSPAFTGDKLSAVTVEIEKSDGSLNTADTSSVTLTIESGPAGATLGGTKTVAAKAGVATFSDLVLSVPGTYTLRATDGSLTPDVSISFTISSKAKASKLSFTVQPAATTAAGKAIAPAVQVAIELLSGVIVLNDTSTVVLSIASGPAGATLGGTLSVKAVNGVATFSNLVLTKAGTYTLKATDGTLTAATSASFTISAAAATKLVYGTQPAASTVAGKAIAPAVVVDIEDQFGNIVTTNTSTVAIALASGAGTLTGTKSIAAKAGVATFSNLLIQKVGTYTIKATDGSLAAVTSAAFKIVAAAAAKLVIAKGPAASTVAGKAFNPAIVIDIVDAFGNIVTTNTSNVTLAVATGSGTFTGATVAAKAGVATFTNLILTKAGVHTFKATDGSLAAATSGNFTITPAAASKLVFAATIPATITTGKAIAPAVVVDVEDQFGNIVTTNTSNVTMSISTGPAGVTLNSTVAAKAGVATFSNIVLTKAGAYALKTADGALTIAKSSSFKVIAAAAKKLVITQPPAAGKVNTTLAAIKVSVEDAFGNVVTTDTSKVTIAIASGPAGAALTGTLAVNAVAGIAMFSTLKLSKAGSYTLKVIDGVLTGATSAAFNIA